MIELASPQNYLEKNNKFYEIIIWLISKFESAYKLECSYPIYTEKNNRGKNDADFW